MKKKKVKYKTGDIVVNKYTISTLGIILRLCKKEYGYNTGDLRWFYEYYSIENNKVNLIYAEFLDTHEGLVKLSKIKNAKRTKI